MVRLFNQATGREIGQISEDEFAFLQDALEEEGPNDTDYYIDNDTIDMLASRAGATQTLIDLLRAAVGDGPDGVDVDWQLPGQERPEDQGRRE